MNPPGGVQLDPAPRPVLPFLCGALAAAAALVLGLWAWLHVAPSCTAHAH